MATDVSLGQASIERQLVFFMDPTVAWEQRLALAHDEAAKHLQQVLPSGTQLDLGAYELNADTAGGQMSSKADVWLSALRAEKDPSLESAISFDGSASKDYYLGHFAQASANLGAFLTGYAREQIATGGLTQDQFNQSCEMRLRAFSDIIYLGRTGMLPAVITPRDFASEYENSPTGLVLGSAGITTIGGGATGGFGILPVIGVAIIGVLVAAGIGVTFFWARENAENRRVALEICQQAVNSGHKDAKEICSDAFDAVTKLADPSGIPSLLGGILPKGLGAQLVTGALAIGAVAIAIKFAPSIASSLSKSRDAYAENQIRRLRRWSEAW